MHSALLTLALLTVSQALALEAIRIHVIEMKDGKTVELVKLSGINGNFKGVTTDGKTIEFSGDEIKKRSERFESPDKINVAGRLDAQMEQGRKNDTLAHKAKQEEAEAEWKKAYTEALAFKNEVYGDFRTIDQSYQSAKARHDAARSAISTIPLQITQMNQQVAEKRVELAGYRKQSMRDELAGTINQLLQNIDHLNTRLALANEALPKIETELAELQPRWEVAKNTLQDAEAALESIRKSKSNPAPDAPAFK